MVGSGTSESERGFIEMSLQVCMNMTRNNNTINSNNINTEPSLLFELISHEHVFVYKLKEVIQFFGKKFNVN